MHVTRKFGAVVLGSAVVAVGTLGVQAMLARHRAGPITRPGFRIDETVNGEADGPTLRVAIIGDSTVEGVGVLHERDTLAVHVARRAASLLERPVHIRGFGITGARAADVLADQVPQLDDGGTYDQVLVAVGANDATHLTTSGSYESRLRRILEGVRRAQPDAEIVIVSVPGFAAARAVPRPLRDVFESRAAALRGRQRELLRELGDERLHYADVYTDPTPRMVANPESISRDGFHPSRIGYGYWADEIGPVMAAAARR
ncbi:MAG: hydrolase family protein [Thermoleophilia bacterium]|nr:hydrolase family protein [Thermoleophilia bacterium]